MRLVTVVLILVCISVWSVGIWGVASAQQRRVHFSDLAVGFTVQQQREIIRECDQQSGEMAFTTCVRDAIGDGLAAVRETADLQAQQGMAQWAAVMAALGVAQLGLSAAGAFFVWRTLSQQLDSNRIAREVGIAQTRAYVGFDGPAQGFQTADGSSTGRRLSVWVGPLVRNSGQSPAVVVSLSTARLDFPADGFLGHVHGVLEIDRRPMGLGTGQAISMVQLGYSEELIEEIVSGRTRSFIIGHCSYTDVFHPETPVHVIQFCYEARFNFTLNWLGTRDVPADFSSFPNYGNFSIDTIEVS